MRLTALNNPLACSNCPQLPAPRALHCPTCCARFSTRTRFRIVRLQPESAFNCPTNRLLTAVKCSTVRSSAVSTLFADLRLLQTLKLPPTARQADCLRARHVTTASATLLCPLTTEQLPKSSRLHGSYGDTQHCAGTWQYFSAVSQ